MICCCTVMWQSISGFSLPLVNIQWLCARVVPPPTSCWIFDFLFLCGCQFTLPVRDDLPALSFGFFYSDNSRSLGSVRALGLTLNCFLFCIWKMEDDAWSSPTTTTTTTTTYVAIVLLWKHASYVAKKSYKILLSCTTMCTFVAERGLF